MPRSSRPKRDRPLSAWPIAILGVLVVALTLLQPTAARADDGGITASISFARETFSKPVDGRVILVVSDTGSSDYNSGIDPREQASSPASYLWAKDVTSAKPNAVAVISGNPKEVAGYPVASLADLPVGTYRIQAFLNVYESVKRSDGARIKVHFPCGDGDDIFTSPGNVYSDAQTVDVTGDAQPLRFTLNHVIQAADAVPPGGTCQQGNPSSTAHVKQVKIKSKLLTKFWGRPIYVAASVLLPSGYTEPKNKRVRYPVEVNEGHYSESAPHGFLEDGSDDFSSWWLGGSAPQFISITLRTENPFYDDSYAVNSANLGPWGDAINDELLPYIDAHYRTIGTRESRVLTGGSTGGWAALASFIEYPDTYAAVWSGYPDPISFVNYGTIDLYSDDNAFTDKSENARGFSRSGSTMSISIVDENSYEQALGPKNRSGGQLAIWNAVYGPKAKDGYPADVFSPQTGAIDPAVVKKWRANDLSLVVKDHWSTLGSKLAGRISIWVGTLDSYYLNGAEETFQSLTSGLENPPPNFSFQYGEGEEHMWEPEDTQARFSEYEKFVEAHGAAAQVTRPQAEIIAARERIRHESEMQVLGISVGAAVAVMGAASAASILIRRRRRTRADAAATTKTN